MLPLPFSTDEKRFSTASFQAENGNNWENHGVDPVSKSPPSDRRRREAEAKGNNNNNKNNSNPEESDSN